MPDSDLFVDTNVFLRLFMEEDSDMTRDCRRLIERAEAGEFELCTSHLALAEIVWTLRSHYRMARTEVAVALRDVLAIQSLRIDEKEMLFAVVDLYESTNVDFIDAYNALDSRRRGIERVCTYDRDFDRLPVQRVEPADIAG